MRSTPRRYDQLPTILAAQYAQFTCLEEMAFAALELCA
jgi:hypothetical protein